MQFEAWKTLGTLSGNQWGKEAWTQGGTMRTQKTEYVHICMATIPSLISSVTSPKGSPANLPEMSTFPYHFLSPSPAFLSFLSAQCQWSLAIYSCPLPVTVYEMWLVRAWTLSSYSLSSTLEHSPFLYWMDWTHSTDGQMHGWMADMCRKCQWIKRPQNTKCIWEVEWGNQETDCDAKTNTVELLWWRVRHRVG